MRRHIRFGVLSGPETQPLVVISHHFGHWNHCFLQTMHVLFGMAQVPEAQRPLAAISILEIDVGVFLWNTLYFSSMPQGSETRRWPVAI